MSRTAACLFLITIISFPVFSDILFSAESSDFGIITQNGIYKRSVTVSNSSDYPVNISINPLCSCLEIDNSEILLGPGKHLTFNILLNTELEFGKISKRIEIRTDDKSEAKIIFFVYAEVNIEENASKVSSITAGPENSSKPDLLLFYSQNCISCIQLIKEELGPYMSGYNIRSYDIIDNLDLLTEELDKLGAVHIATPVLIYSKNVLQGEESFKNNLKKILIDKRTVTDGFESDPVALNLLTSIIGGLSDGINPCAFSTLVFLLSALAYIGKRKKEVLVTGIVFSFTVFTTYFFIGLGFFRALLILDRFFVISCIIKWILLIVLLVFAVLSLIDFILILKGKTQKILLQLPKYIKKKIHESIRTKIRSAALISSTVVLGFLVSVFELGCTGQIYFPYITSLVGTSTDIKSFFYLLIYNICFIIPLAAVFILSYKGLSNERLSDYFKNHIAIVKLSIFIFFLVLAVITFIFNYSCFIFTI